MEISSGRLASNQRKHEIVESWVYDIVLNDTTRKDNYSDKLLRAKVTQRRGVSSS